MPKQKNGQINASDRMVVEQGLRESLRIPDIAKKIGVAPSSITREIKRNAVTSSPSFIVVETRNICLRKDVCHHHGLCENGCIMPCSTCKKNLCNKVCPEFLPNKCPWLTKPPFVCNDCRRRYGSGCEYEYSFYDGKLAHELAQERKVKAREGIDCTREELEAMADFVRPLIKQGQSPENIWLNFGAQLPVSLRTFYHYVEIGVFDNIINLNLQKKVSYKQRKKKKELLMPRGDLEGREYEDFKKLSDDEQMSAVQMDCVEGRHHDKAAILTLLFRRIRFQLMIYLPEKNQKEVAKALDQIERIIGQDAFHQWFGLILTDRGSEFLDYARLERSYFKGERCKIYYCDSMSSYQKGSCEKNHVELRKVIPKGTSFKNLTPEKLAVVCSHVNSYGRPILGGIAPYTLASQMLPGELLDAYGIVFIPPKEVVMKPGLIEL